VRVRIKSYSGAQGFGYIAREAESDLLFDVTACQHFTPRVGDQVEVEIAHGRDGQPRAHAVRLRARTVPNPSERPELAARWERVRERYRRVGLLGDASWGDLCEHFLRQRDQLPEEITPQDVIALLLQRYERGLDRGRVAAHPRELHTPQAIAQIEGLLADTPVRVEIVRQHGDQLTLHDPDDGPPQQRQVGTLVHLLALYNHALARAGVLERLLRVPCGSDGDLILRLSIEQAWQLHEHRLLPICWDEVEPYR
jgi:cold shock CspA family protein